MRGAFKPLWRFWNGNLAICYNIEEEVSSEARGECTALIKLKKRLVVKVGVEYDMYAPN
jgi:hypothetical protein